MKQALEKEMTIPVMSCAIVVSKTICRNAEYA